MTKIMFTRVLRILAALLCAALWMVSHTVTGMWAPSTLAEKVNRSDLIVLATLTNVAVTGKTPIQRMGEGTLVVHRVLAPSGVVLKSVLLRWTMAPVSTRLDHSNHEGHRRIFLLRHAATNAWYEANEPGRILGLGQLDEVVRAIKVEASKRKKKKRGP